MMRAKDIVRACADAREPALASFLIADAATAEAVAKRLDNAAGIRASASLARTMLPDLEDAAVDELVLADISAEKARERLYHAIVDAHEGPEIDNKHNGGTEPDPAVSWEQVIKKEFGE